MAATAPFRPVAADARQPPRAAGRRKGLIHLPIRTDFRLRAPGAAAASKAYSSTVAGGAVTQLSPDGGVGRPGPNVSEPVAERRTEINHGMMPWATVLHIWRGWQVHARRPPGVTS